MWSDLRSQLTGKRLLRLLLIVLVLGIATVLAFGNNNIGSAQTLRSATHHAELARHFADSQSAPIPASTARGGSSS